MSQKYYTERLLPVYIDTIQKFRAQNPAVADKWILQEDNDPSHGHILVGLAQTLKNANGIKTLVHPAQSPDLNPIEACWHVIKQRARRRVWHTLEEYKAILEDEWANLTQVEIQRRINEMPNRCRLIIKHDGKSIKSSYWRCT